MTGQYSQIFREMLAEANNNPEEKFKLARRLWSGSGGITTGCPNDDHSQALALCREAAEHGHCEAQKRLFNMYRNDNRCERNLAESLRFGEMAAAQGHVEVINFLIRIYQGEDALFGSACANSDKAEYWHCKLNELNGVVEN